MADTSRVLYSAFGLSLVSNLTIPGLVPSYSPSSSAHIEIHLASQPSIQRSAAAGPDELHYTSREIDESGEPAFRIWRLAGSDLLRMDYVDGVRFWLAQDGTAVWCTWPENLTVRDGAVYLLGPILGVLLRLRGVTCLHASAVALGGRAVAFAGPPGAGKSTTATAIGQRGHAILSDDIVAIEERDGRFFALPAHPYVCLWPESVEMLYGKPKTVPGFAGTWDKGRLLLAEHDLKFQDRPAPLCAVYVLGDRTSDTGMPMACRLNPQKSLMALVANSYGTNVLEEKMRVREFGLLSRLANAVPVSELRTSSGRKLPDLCSFVESNFDREQPFRAQAGQEKLAGQETGATEIDFIGS